LLHDSVFDQNKIPFVSRDLSPDIYQIADRINLQCT